MECIENGPTFQEVTFRPQVEMPQEPLYKQSSSQIQYVEYQLDDDDANNLKWQRSSISQMVSADRHKSVIEFEFLTPPHYVFEGRLYLISGSMIENVEWTTMEPLTFRVQIIGISRIFVIKAVSPRVTRFWHNMLLEVMKEDRLEIQPQPTNSMAHQTQRRGNCCHFSFRVLRELWQEASVIINRAVRRLWRNALTRQ